jgi:hypothetical protein
MFPELFLRPIGLGISESIGSVHLWWFIKRLKRTIIAIYAPPPLPLTQVMDMYYARNQNIMHRAV